MTCWIFCRDINEGLSSILESQWVLWEESGFLAHQDVKDGCGRLLEVQYSVMTSAAAEEMAFACV